LKVCYIYVITNKFELINLIYLFYIEQSILAPLVEYKQKENTEYEKIIEDQKKEIEELRLLVTYENKISEEYFSGINNIELNLTTNNYFF